MLFVIVALAGLVPGAASAAAQTLQAAEPASTAIAADRNLPALPPPPPGKTTILGGQIRSVDPVRDEFDLHIIGQRPMKIFYDERTQTFRDGVKFPLRDLRPEDYASVETTLDGANVFAVSIHILSHSPEGECQGRVLRYNPYTRELLISTAESPQPIRLFVPASASIGRVGEPAFTSQPSGTADLVAGALVSASFASRAGRQNAVSQITVLAVPGASFLFWGNVSFLDLHSGVLVLADPRDQKSYEIAFSPAAFTVSQKLHLGVGVTVKASYDGTRFTADSITIH